MFWSPWGIFTAAGEHLVRLWPADYRAWRRREQARLNRQGWTACNADDRRRVAAPLRDQTGEVLGALVVVGTPAEVDPRLNAIGKQLVAEAVACSRRLRR